MAREILAERKFKHTSVATSVSLNYLETRNQYTNFGMRKIILGFGGSAQRNASALLQKIPDFKSFKSKKIFQLLKSPMPATPKDTLRSIMPLCDTNQAILAEPEKEALHTVFYFPGCGSERLFSDIGKASLYLLLKNRTRVILPPPFLCCGYHPARVNANTEQKGRITLWNTIIFSQIRDMFNDLKFDACIISCGTCRESLEELETGAIFDCKITDISRFIMNINGTINSSKKYLYHAPCHDSLNGEGFDILTKEAGLTVEQIPHCCSEAGTMAISRPDISNAMLERKEAAIRSVTGKREATTTMLTNCPSCIQGLGRNNDLKVNPVHISTELAELTNKEQWKKELKELMKNCEIITF